MLHFAENLLETYALRNAGESHSAPPATTLNFDIGRGDKIRTCDPLHPMQVRYQAAPRPDRV
jgi:hypothetical protein